MGAVLTSILLGKWTSLGCGILDLTRSEVTVRSEVPLLFADALTSLSRGLIEKLRDLKIAAAAFLTPFLLDHDGGDDEDSCGFFLFASRGREASLRSSIISERPQSHPSLSRALQQRPHRQRSPALPHPWRTIRRCAATALPSAENLRPHTPLSQ